MLVTMERPMSTVLDPGNSYSLPNQTTDLPIQKSALVDTSSSSLAKFQLSISRYGRVVQSVQKAWKICLLVLIVVIALVRLFSGYALSNRGLKVVDNIVYSGDHLLLSTQATSNINLARAVAASSSPPTSTGVLECFQVQQPVFTPEGPVDTATGSDGVEETTSLTVGSTKESCTVVLMDHVFGYSYGVPFISNYTPPSCNFNRVVMNFTVTSRGRQFDRLALMYLGDTEVWRTSTAEPTTAGIEWTYFKDMSEYLYFWKQSQTLIFDLGNIQDSTYTGSFNTTLTATFFSEDSAGDAADLIVPISARLGSSNKASVFLVPAVNASNTIILPRNINRAVFSVSACGQADEEFWWGNLLTEDINTFPLVGTLYGYSPFREITVLIDGNLAGVQWPFPVIFTGGVVPGLWRPIVGIDAFDLREHEIDITPWLGVLCDGAEHTFEIRVSGINDDSTLTRTVGASWYLTGKIFLWLDDISSVTTGSAPTLSTPVPTIEISRSFGQDSTGANVTLLENTRVQRSLVTSANIQTQHHDFTSEWSQILSYSNLAQITAYGEVTINTFLIEGKDVSVGVHPYSSTYSYPLFCNQSYVILPDSNGANFSLGAIVTRGLIINTDGASIYPSGAEAFSASNGISSLSAAQLANTTLSTTQNGSATYISYDAASQGTLSFGSTSQHFSFAAADDAELYSRDVAAVNATIVYDRETLLGLYLRGYVASSASESTDGEVAVGEVTGGTSAREMTGRGSGAAKVILVQGGDGS